MKCNVDSPQQITWTPDDVRTLLDGFATHPDADTSHLSEFLSEFAAENKCHCSSFNDSEQALVRMFIQLPQSEEEWLRASDTAATWPSIVANQRWNRTYSHIMEFLPVVVCALEGSLTSYAMEIVVEQCRLLKHLKAPTVLDAGSQTFAVSGHGKPTESSATDEDDTVSATDDNDAHYEAEDVAPERAHSGYEAVVHHTTPTTCTCQFPNSRGLPCRHILKVLDATGATEVPDGVIHSHWKITDEYNQFHEHLSTLHEQHNSMSTATKNQTLRDLQRKFGLVLRACTASSHLRTIVDRFFDGIIQFILLGIALTTFNFSWASNVQSALRKANEEQNDVLPTANPPLSRTGRQAKRRKKRGRSD